MQASTTLLYNAMTYGGYEPIVGGVPVPGLNTLYNRGQWLSWHEVYRHGTPDWTVPDSWVDGCIAQGLIPVALLAGDPSGKKLPDMVAWTEFCKVLAARYLGRVRHWEVGNEIDTESSWLFDNFNGEAAGKVMRAASDVFMAADPGALVICGSIQSIWPTGHGLQTLAGMLRGFGPELPRAISVHVYPDDFNPEIVGEMLMQVRGVLWTRAKSECQLWVTEWGRTGFSKMAESAQSAFLGTMLRQMKSARVDVSMHYLFDDASVFGFASRKAGLRLWNAAMGAINSTPPAPTLIGTKNGALSAGPAVLQSDPAGSALGRFFNA